MINRKINLNLVPNLAKPRDDIGNAYNMGQVVLLTIREIKQPNSNLYRTVSNLPMVTEEFKELLEVQMDNNEPSCSHAEALEKQDLFINSTLANKGHHFYGSCFVKV